MPQIPKRGRVDETTKLTLIPMRQTLLQRRSTRFTKISRKRALHVPGDMTCIHHDLQIRHRSDQTLLVLVEAPFIGEDRIPLAR